MALELQAATLHFPVAPHNPDNPKTATLHAVVSDDAIGLRGDIRPIAIEVSDEERAALLARVKAALASVGIVIAMLLLAVLSAGCGDDDCVMSCAGKCNGSPTPDCARVCESRCEAARNYDSPEHVGEAASALSIASSAYYGVAYEAGYGPSTGDACNAGSSTWCACNVVYTDAVPSHCDDPAHVIFWEFQNVGAACSIGSATLSYTASMGASGRAVDLRRILRPVTTPPMGYAGTCAPSTSVSWWRSGSQAWTTPGAKGDGTDRTATGPSRTLTQTAPHTETFDVTALAQGCPASGKCVIAQYASAHVNVGAATLDITCGDPVVCGDGVKAGAEGCDDGNGASGDGCSAACAIEAGWTCAGAPSVCTTTCGDGIKAGAEQCDDGNAMSGDGCSASCGAEVCSCQ